MNVAEMRWVRLFHSARIGPRARADAKSMSNAMWTARESPFNFVAHRTVRCTVLNMKLYLVFTVSTIPCYF